MTGSNRAATILALRPAYSGFEVLMVHRNSRGFFGDIVVFPGGKVDDVDVPDGLTHHDDLSHRNAALREFAEETGILMSDEGPVAASGAKDRGYYEWLAAQPFSSAVDSLVLVSRWVTPDPAPRRFDTRFYVVGCIDPPDVRIDAEELVGHEWVTPGDALERFDGGDWSMMHPTVAHLRWLGRWSSIEDAIRSAEGADRRTLITPQILSDGSLLPIHMPTETA